jgi:hypothetical protein
MIYLFVEAWDPVGEGVRANLLEFASIEGAHTRFDSFRRDENTIRTKILQGDVIESWEAERELSSDDLRTSAIEGVDDLTNKENV